MDNVRAQNRDLSAPDLASRAKRTKLEQRRRAGDVTDVVQDTSLAYSAVTIVYHPASANKARVHAQVPANGVAVAAPVAVENGAVHNNIYQHGEEEDRKLMTQNKPPPHYVVMSSPTRDGLGSGPKGVLSPLDLVGFGVVVPLLHATAVLGSTSTSVLSTAVRRAYVERGGVLHYVNTGCEQLLMGDKVYALPCAVALGGAAPVDPNNLHNTVRVLRPFIIVSAKFINAVFQGNPVTVPEPTRELLRLTAGWAPSCARQDYRTKVIESSRALAGLNSANLGRVLADHQGQYLGVVTHGGMPGDIIQVTR